MVTSLLLEVNYKFISGSFGRKPWLNLFYIKGGGGVRLSVGSNFAIIINMKERY